MTVVMFEQKGSDPRTDLWLAGPRLPTVGAIKMCAALLKSHIENKAIMSYRIYITERT